MTTSAMPLNDCRHKIPRHFVSSALFSLAMLATLPAIGQAQSGTKAPAAAPARSSAGSSTRGANQEVALNGYCPVCVIEMKKWIKGNANFAAQYDGKTYLFPGEEQRQMFLKNPAKYVPALGGECSVCLVEMKKHIPGSVRFASLYGDRLFLFPGEEQKQMFLKNPARYVDVDLAANGNCTVCRVEMNQTVPGNSDFTVVHKGLRYQFPGREQQDMFLANPAKYEVK